MMRFLYFVAFLMTSSALPVNVTDHLRLALDAILGVGIRLQAFLKDDDGDNFLVSPISATVILGELLLGAEGDFREQLVQLLALPNGHLFANDKLYTVKDKNLTYSLPYSTLHLQLASLIKSMESRSGIAQQFTLKEKSAVFISNEMRLKREFKKNLKSFYSVDVNRVDFARKPQETVLSINQWASDHTNGLIEQVFDQPLPLNTASIFLNAIYFLAEWETPFSDVLNRVGPFQVTPDKQVNVTYMMGYVEQIPYLEEKHFRMIALPYKSEELMMYVMLPKPNGKFDYDVKTFVQNLKSSDILDAIGKMKRRDVTIKMPKMTLTSQFSVLDRLKKYAAYKRQEDQRIVFDEDENIISTLEKKVHEFANFSEGVNKSIYLSNAAENVNLRIDDIIQQVSITVNEKGTEAAAVSATTIDYMGGAKNFLLDKPFVFFILHQGTGASLFWGTISNPAA